MASRLFPLHPQSAAEHWEPRRWDTRRWPATIRARQLLRLVLCIPYVALAAWAALRGVRFPADAELAHAAAALNGGLGFLAQPRPLALLVARVLPGAPGSLAVVGALGAGGLVQLVWERLVRARAPRWLTVLLIVGFAAAPFLWWTALSNLAGIMGLACLAVAITGTLEFLFGRRTSAGYAAGVSLALAMLCDPLAVICVAAVLVAAPFLAWPRLREEPYSVRSTLAILAFPSVALVGIWAFLEWRFTGVVGHIPFMPIGAHLGSGVLSALGRAGSQAGWNLVCAPIFVLSALFALRRRALAFVAFCLVPAALFVAELLGLHASPVTTVALMSVLGLVAVPSLPARVHAVLYAAAVPASLVVPLVVMGSADPGSVLHALGM